MNMLRFALPHALGWIGIGFSLIFTNKSCGAAGPYPPSQWQLTWETNLVRLRPGAGDNWPMTWVSNDVQITSWGDGEGFQPGKPRLSLGLARLFGNPPELRGENFASTIDTPEGGGSRAIKTSGLLMVDGVLYLWVRNYRPPGSDDFRHAQLFWSADGGAHWNWASWYFAETFGCPEFVQFGPNYTGARDGFVYIVSQDNNSAYGYSPDIVMARVRKDKVADRSSYEFFTGLGTDSAPRFSADLESRKPIFTDPNGTQRIAITHDAGFQRYLLTTSHRPPRSTAMHTAALGVFEALEPWGPWRTLYYDDHWSGTNRTYHHKFPTKWMSADGLTLWLVYSGLDGSDYTLCVRKAKLEKASEKPQAALMPRILGDWWTIAEDSDLGAYTSPKQQPVDFAIWPAADGTWQLWFCIRGTQSAGNTRLFYHWEGQRLTDSHWSACGIAMQAKPEFGETRGGLQAPFVFRNGQQFLMFYGDWEHICAATSTDGKSFTRRMSADGKTGMFGERRGSNTRDPMVLFTRGQWHCYYTAHPHQRGADYCRTSADTLTWSEPRIVAQGGVAGTNAYSAECPFVVELTPGEYYLFRTQRYGQNAVSRVYHSRDPLDFGVNHDADHYVGDLPVAAPEIFQHDGQCYMASLLPNLKGMRVARLNWRPAWESKAKR